MLAGVPCPECGEPEPPRDWIVVQGRSVPGNPLWFVAGACLLLTMITIPALMVVRTGKYVFLVHGAFLLSASIYLFYRSRALYLSLEDGGDVTWILKPDVIEERGPHWTRETSWRECDHVLFERGFTSNAVRLTVTKREAMGDKGLPSIWVDTRVHDARQLQAIARERIEHARR